MKRTEDKSDLFGFLYVTNPAAVNQPAFEPFFWTCHARSKMMKETSQVLKETCEHSPKRNLEMHRRMIGEGQ